MTQTKHFQGSSYAECRAQWSQFCEARMDELGWDREPFMIRAEAHKTGGLYELSVTYRDGAPEDM